MTKKRQIQASKIKLSIAAGGVIVHVRLSAEVVAKLDALARKNNIARAAVVAIASSRIAETGL